MSAPSTPAAPPAPPPRVAVLMSTYNGADYLPEQLQSLLEQSGVQIDLIVRDDGSTDGTVEVLRSYQALWPRLAQVPCGPNLGPAASFFELLRLAPEDADFYAFCDQDDVWLPGKLQRAIAHLGSPDETKPILYCSNVLCTDEALGVRGMAPENGDGRFQHLLFENIAYGCTTVMNRAARTLITSRLPERGVIMHDWWCALVVAAFGEVRYDPKPEILYRQHGRNSIGAEKNPIALLLKRARQFARDPTAVYRIHGQANELMRLHGDALPPDRRILVANLIAAKRSLKARARYAARGPVFRRSLADAIVARALIAAGWY